MKMPLIAVWSNFRQISHCVFHCFFSHFFPQKNVCFQTLEGFRTFTVFNLHCTNCAIFLLDSAITKTTLSKAMKKTFLLFAICIVLANNNKTLADNLSFPFFPFASNRGFLLLFSPHLRLADTLCTFGLRWRLTLQR